VTSQTHPSESRAVSVAPSGAAHTRKAGRRASCGWRAVAILLLTAAAAAQDPQRLARIGDRQVTADEFRQLLRAMREAGRTDTTLETLTPLGRERLLNALVEKDLYALAAREDGLDRREDVRFWIDQAVTEVLAKKYLEHKARQVDVSDAALRAFYDAHPDLLATPRRVKVRHIVLASKAEADAALAEARAGREFAQLAQARSVDTATRTQGGDLGWLTRGVMVPAFEDLAFSLKRGEVGGPVETRLGFHVVKLDEVDEPALPSFDAIKSQVRERKVALELGELKAQLMVRYPVTIQRDVLESFGR
jgi:peptidyl-prolyl cis-trans isomerase C